MGDQQLFSNEPILDIMRLLTSVSEGENGEPSGWGAAVVGPPLPPSFAPPPAMHCDAQCRTREEGGDKQARARGGKRHPPRRPTPPPSPPFQGASLLVAGRELLRLHNDLFVDHCRGCAGSGRLTCAHCAGSGSLRARPAVPSVRRLALLASSPRDVYACPHCGPPSPYDTRPDLDEELEGDPPLADALRANIKAALLGARLLPRATPILAGTVACPHCGGEPRVRRFTPALRALLPAEVPFQTRAALRAGDIVAPGTDTRRPYGEPPSAPLVDPFFPALVDAARAGRAAVASRARDDDRGARRGRDAMVGLQEAFASYFEDVVGVGKGGEGGGGGGGGKDKGKEGGGGGEDDDDGFQD